MQSWRRPGRASRVSQMMRFVFVLVFAACLQGQQQLFVARCAVCHGADAHGTAQAPGLAMNPRVAEQSAEQLQAYIKGGNANAGMPSFADLSAADLASLARYLKRLNNDKIVTPAAPVRKIEFGPPQAGDWRTYNGSDSGNRYSPLKQI